MDPRVQLASEDGFSACSKLIFNGLVLLAVQIKSKRGQSGGRGVKGANG